ncbi:MAG: sialate O-acetylesterase [Bacteroidales bacterium]|nr:sialate O-acetylesterase [Bacteroidales bacterium]
MKKTLIFATLLLMYGSALDAKVTLPSVISDNMVLQQQTDVALWGKAEPGKKVTVTTSWNNAKTVIPADKQTGKWLVRIATPAAGGPYQITISDGEAVTLRNVLVGEVWFCSGQSNMEMPMMGYDSQPAKGAVKYIAGAKASTPIRICNVTKKSSKTPLETSEGSWCENTPDAVAATSATAYYFARQLQAATDIPVGIIVTCWGGSSIETWIPKEVIEKEFPEFSLDHLTPSGEIHSDNQDPCLCFNGQVAPLIPYTFKGMIWYQGETNRGRPEQYIRLQDAYTRSMREIFSVPEAPFYFVQIAPYPYDNPDGFCSGYFYEAQQKSLDVIPRSGMAVTCDIGEYGTIHPCLKEAVGDRLAYLALQNDYGFPAIKAVAPTYKSVEFLDGKAIVRFNVDSEGLSPMGGGIPGFEIAGDDKVFHKAYVSHIYGNSVEVFCEEVPEPVAVRYCFRNWCVGGLYNNYGIPAAPFRTDDWDL